jgi:hypothetical protein
MNSLDVCIVIIILYGAIGSVWGVKIGSGSAVLSSLGALCLGVGLTASSGLRLHGYVPTEVRTSAVSCTGPLQEQVKPSAIHSSARTSSPLSQVTR